jgi:hypothetical protein
MIDEARLKKVLEALPVDDPEVDVVTLSAPRLVATVTSRSFAGMDEGERQELVWHHLYAQLDGEADVWIEFVLTNAPGETGEDAEGDAKQPS